jgi:two-component system, NtrC family, sensor kinase
MMSSLDSTTILIVDDTPENLEVLSAALIDAGYRVSVAIDGESAIEQISFAPPELILLDVMMPGIDGFETCRRLKSSPATQDIPVLFMTALSETESKVRGLSLGAVDYITKPFQRQEVLARVRVHLQLRNFAQTLASQNQLLKQEIDQRKHTEVELSKTLLHLQQAQVRLVQKEKLSALGELIAGVAHEINNPVNFISSNISPAQTYVAEMINILHLYQATYPSPTPDIQAACDAADLSFVLQDLPKLLTSMDLGAERLREISASLRNFSRSDQDQPSLVNLHTVLDGTVLILSHRLKAVGDRPATKIIKQYGNIPLMQCYAGQMGQVFMNILANAIDALEEANQGKTYAEIEANPACITIHTVLINGDRIKIQIADNGAGMPDAIKQNIFNHLFTTKEVGKGTGLGLAIARQIVMEKHGGAIEVNSTVGHGTEFSILLPVETNVTPLQRDINLTGCKE